MEGSPAPPYHEPIRHPGNEALHFALELSALGVARGHPMHVHAEGLRGTGKTTGIRAAARLLPSILRIAGCVYNCDPAHPHCPLHRGLSPAEVVRLGTESVPAPFLEISPSAKIGTVVGAIDLARLTDAAGPAAALLPGTLARAHRGVVFVDEVNRLADTAPELADALLDVMGTKPGRLQIEETGLAPVVLSCRVSVWAASNPDEEPGPLADIRRQLADRFDLGVAMRRPTETETVLAVLRRADLGREGDGPGATGPGEVAGEAVGGVGAEGAASPIPEGSPRLRLELQARGGQAAPRFPPELRGLLARIYCECQVESLRAVEAWQAAASLSALRSGRPEVALGDVQRTAPLALRHRLDAEELARVLARLERGPASGPEAGGHGAALAGAAPALSREAGRQAPGADVPPAASEAPRPWWRRRGRTTPAPAPEIGRGEQRGGADRQPRLADPCTLPVITPGQRARFLSDLPPGEWVTPSTPRGGGPP